MNLLTTIMICSMFQDNGIVNAMIQKGSNQNPYMITTVSRAGETGTKNDHFKTAAQAAAYAKEQLKDGKHVEIGMMQIPSGWLDRLAKNGVTLDDLLRPCKNIAVGTDLLNQSEAYCATRTDNAQERNTCALSFYKTGSTRDGVDYAQVILNYAAITPFQSNPASAKVDYNAYLQSKAFRLPAPVFDEADEKAEQAADAAPQPKADASDDADDSSDDNDVSTDAAAPSSSAVAKPSTPSSMPTPSDALSYDASKGEVV